MGPSGDSTRSSQNPPDSDRSVVFRALENAETLDADSVQNTGSLLAPEPSVDPYILAKQRALLRKRIIRYGSLGFVLLVSIGVALVLQFTHKKPSTTTADASQKYANTTIPLTSLSGLADGGQLSVMNGQVLSVNGQLNVNNSLVLSPTSAPKNGIAGQLYYDKDTNQLSYFNGKQYVTVLAGNSVVSGIGGATGNVTTGVGLSVANGQIANTGVLTLQGEAGNVTLTAGNGIAISGTTISSTAVAGVTSLGGQNGIIAVGSGLDASGGTLRNTGIISATGSGTITVTNDGNGNIVIDGPNGSGGGGGTVASPGGTIGKIAKFTGVQTVADSLISESGSTITIGGSLSVTGPGVITGNGSGITNVNASNLSSGTVSDSRLSSNVALQSGNNNFTGTLQHNGNNVCDASNNCGYLTGAAANGSYVALGPSSIQGDSSTNDTIFINKLGASGNLVNLKVAGTSKFVVDFSGNVTATSFTGNGSGLTNVNAATLGGNASGYYTNASNLSSGTVSDSRLSTNVALLSGNNNFAGTLQHSGNNVCDASNNCGYLTGAAANSSYVALGPASIQGDSSTNDTIFINKLGGSGNLINLQVGGTTTFKVDHAGNVTATTYTGNGSGLTNVNAVTLGGNASSYFTNASNISTGTLGDSRLSTNVALQSGNNNFTGTLQHSGNSVCDASNNCGYLTGSAANGSFVQFAPAATQTDSTTNSTISVNKTGASGNLVTLQVSGTPLFTVDHSGNVVATSFTGNGSGLTNVNAATLGGNASGYYTNASNLATGTLNDSRLSVNVALYNAATANFTGVLQHNGNSVCDTSNNCNYLTGSAASGSYVALGPASIQGDASNNNSIYLNKTGASGNLIQLQKSGADQFIVSQNGTVTANNLTLQTLSANATSTTCLVIDTGTKQVGTATCSTGTGTTTTLQTAYDSSATANKSIVLDGSNSANGVVIKDGTVALGANLLSVKSNDGSSTYFAVSATGVTGSNFSGNGSGLTNVNAATLNGNASSYFTNASNLATGTLSDSRLSTNVALLSANNNFTGTLQHNGNNVCDASNNCGYLTGSAANGSYVALAPSSIQGDSSTNDTILINKTGTSGNLINIKVAGNAKFTVDFGGNVTATSYTGNGSGLTNVNAATLGGNASSYYTNASNLSTGTISDTRLSTNVALLSANNNFTGTTLQHSGNAVCDASNNCGYLTGSAASGSYVQFAPAAAQADSTTNSTIFVNKTGASGNLVTLQVSGTPLFTVDHAGNVVATSFTGNGSGLTNVNAATLNGNASSYFTNASNLSTGTVSDSRLSTNVALLSANNNFTGTTLQHNGNNVCDASNNCGYLTGSSASGSYVALAPSSIQGDSSTNDTILINKTGASGNLVNLKVAGTSKFLVDFTGNVTATGFSGSGTNLTALNGSNISSGTVSDSRLSTNVALYNASTANFTGTLQHNGNNVCDASNNCGYLTGAAANGSYIQLQATTPGTAQTGNLNITGTAIFGALQAGSSNQFQVNSSGNITTTGKAVVNTSNAAAFQVQNGSGVSILGVDTASDKILIGNANTDTGHIVLYTAGSTHEVTIQSAQQTGDYTLTIPVLTANDTLCTIGTGCGSSGGTYVNLKATTPGTADHGNINVDGTGIFGTALSTLQFTATGQTVLGGGTNQTQVIIKANSGQTNTNPLLVFNDSTNTELLRISADNYSDTFIGNAAGFSNSGVRRNTFVGSSSGASNTTGQDNTALGYNSLVTNVTGYSNTAIGSNALLNSTGNNNTGIGMSSLLNTTTGNDNVAFGSGTLINNTTGSENSALGNNAGSNDYSGHFVAGSNLQNATSIGAYATAQASNSIVLGSVDLATKVGIGTSIPQNLFSVSPVYYSTGTASQSGTTVTGVGTTWTPTMVGMQFIFSNGATGTITAVGSSTSLTLSTSQTVSSQSYRIHTGGFQVNNSGNTFIQNTSSTAFQIQNAGGSTLLTADTLLNIITIGNGGNTISLSASGGFTASGTAQHTKTISLNAEYAGAVLDAQSDSSCSSASNGTMTSGYDYTNDMSYYNWLGSSSAQCYDVVARVTLPADFSSWTSSAPLTLQVYTQNTTTGTVNIDVHDAAKASIALCSYASATPASANTWTSVGSSCSLSSGTFYAGGNFTIRIRMTADASTNVRIGDLKLSYKSSF